MHMTNVVETRWSCSKEATRQSARQSPSGQAVDSQIYCVSLLCLCPSRKAWAALAVAETQADRVSSLKNLEQII